MIAIDYKDTHPIYEQIVERFQHLILKGVLPQDTKMPSVRSLAMELSINPNTIQKAYDRLEQNGFLYTVKGRGCFVSCSESLVSFKKQELLDKLSELAAQAFEIGITEEEVIAAVRTRAAGHKPEDPPQKKYPDQNEDVCRNMNSKEKGDTDL